MSLPKYAPKGEVKMRIEFNKTNVNTCGGAKPGFRVQRACSHGCDCIGTLLVSQKAPDEALVMACAPCGRPGTSIRGHGRNVRNVEREDEKWVFEMEAELFEYRPATLKSEK